MLLQAASILAPFCAQGDVLLEVHNTHHFQAFLSEVRSAVAAGRFDAYREWFWHRQSSLEPRQEEIVCTGLQQESAGEGSDSENQDRGGVTGVKRSAWVRLKDQTQDDEEQQRQKQPRSGAV